MSTPYNSGIESSATREVVVTTITESPQILERDIPPKLPAEQPENPPQRKTNRWKTTALMIWDRIAGHRNGYVFQRTIRASHYESCIKEPCSLESVKSKIRDGTITTAREFHRAMTLVFANAIMYNDVYSDVSREALEMKKFVDLEIQNWIIHE